LSLYLDASAVVPLFVPEPQHPDMHAFLAGCVLPFELSSLVRGEFVSAMGRYVRRGEMSPLKADENIVEFEAWRAANCRIRPMSDLVLDAATLLVRRFDLALRVPDAIHLVMARSAAVPLVTLDDRLLRAADQIGIAAVRPG